MRPVDPEAWRAMLALQDGAVSRQQCRTHGITDAAIRNAIYRKRWGSAGPGTYLTELPPSPRALLHAALLRIGGLVVASHDSALWLGGVGAAPARPHVAVLDERSVVRCDDAVIHHLPDLGPERVHWDAAPPRTRIETTVLDLTDKMSGERGVVDLLTRAIGEGATTTSRLAEAVASRPRLRHRRLVVDLLADVGQGAHSPLEVRDIRNDRRHGLPPGRRQAERRIDGRHTRVDVVYEGAGLLRAVVKELDGQLGHADDAGRWRDLDRDNAAEARGESHLRYGWRDLVDRPCAVAAQVVAVLHLNGWTGRPRPCSAECPVR